MKNVFTIILLISYFFVNTSTSFAQSIFLVKKKVEYCQEFLECDTNYEELIRLIGQENEPDTFKHNGQLFSGCAKADYPDNNMYYIMYIKNGFVEHQLQYFHNGQKAADFNFKNGKSHGYHTMYYENGQKYIEEFSQNGVKQGVHRRWYGDGQLAREVWWKNGILIDENLYDESGNKIK